MAAADGGGGATVIPMMVKASTSSTSTDKARFADRFPAEQHHQPQYEVQKDRGKDENPGVDAPFGTPDGQCRTDVTCEHG